MNTSNGETNKKQDIKHSDNKNNNNNSSSSSYNNYSSSSNNNNYSSSRSNNNNNNSSSRSNNNNSISRSNNNNRRNCSNKIQHSKQTDITFFCWLILKFNLDTAHKANPSTISLATAFYSAHQSTTKSRNTAPPSRMAS